MALANGWPTTGPLEWAAAFFPQLPVIAFTEMNNLASRSVMGRLGLREAGVTFEVSSRGVRVCIPMHRSRCIETTEHDVPRWRLACWV
jgi:hypothetical protein